MNIDNKLIEKFEKQLDPQNIKHSSIPAKLIGYGEISSIFELEDLPGIIFKRMPMFTNIEDALNYAKKYDEYCKLLKIAGITLPDDETIIVKKSDNLTVLYIAQEKFDSKILCNKLIKTLEVEEVKELASKIVNSINNVWKFNKDNENIELAIDSQISNWAYKKESDELFYVDTSTPLFKIRGIEQMDPELVLTSAPSFARAIIRKFFLADVMNRYYDEKSVNIDLVANLYKEQKSELIPCFLDVINNRSSEKISKKEIDSYYKEDKFIWSLFLNMRRLDKWLYKHVYKKQYEFILPGEIKR